VDSEYLKSEQLPKIPTVEFELGWRNIVDMETQNRILEEIKKITWDIDRKIYIAIKLLRTYIAMRPVDIIRLQFSDIDYADGIIILKRPSKRKKQRHKPVQPKYVPLLAEDLELLKSIPRGLPPAYIFVHAPGIKGATVGERYGQRLLWKKWTEACNNLGIHGVDLYGGTKHSTATALSKRMSPEQIQQGIMLESNEAFRRYLLPDITKAQMVYEQADSLSKQAEKSKVIDFKRDQS
jgi:integrase